MSDFDPVRLNALLRQAIGPTPWYWQGYPSFRAASGERFVWRHQGEQGPVGYVVSLSLQQELEKPRLALNTYCRPFLVSPHYLGIWCPEARSLRLTCFDPDQLKTFDFGEIAGWFKQSNERIYAATAPVAELEIPISLTPGAHKLDVPPELATVEELILPTSYKAMSKDDPAFALFVVYPQAGLVEVLPQKWFTSAQFNVGPKWISRVVRDPESHRIIGECFGVGTFLLDEDGCRLDRWIEKTGA